MAISCGSTPLPRRAVIAAATGTLLLLGLAPLVGFGFAPLPWAGLAAIVAALATVAVVYGRAGRSPRAAALCAGLAIWMWNALVWGFLGWLASAAGFPLRDRWFGAVDRALGFDHHAFVDAISQSPLVVDLLAGAYVATVPALVAAIVALALAGAFERLVRLLDDFAGSLAVTIAVSLPLPALGPSVVDPLPPGTDARLPDGAGDFYLPLVEALRDGGLRVLDPRLFDGVVTFPSFHVVMALLVARAAAGVPGLGILAAAFAAAVIVSAVPIGGHYGVDVIAGALLFWAVARTSARRPVAAPAC